MVIALRAGCWINWKSEVMTILSRKVILAWHWERLFKEIKSEWRQSTWCRSAISWRAFKSLARFRSIMIGSFLPCGLCTFASGPLRGRISLGKRDRKSAVMTFLSRKSFRHFSGTFSCNDEADGNPIFEYIRHIILFLSANGVKVFPDL
jgi:hypothetical protein